MELIFPQPNHKEKALSFKQEFFDNGENEISGDGGFDKYSVYEEWLAKIEGDITRESGSHVSATTCFAFIDDEIVGIIQIRHKLNDYLLKYGGHIGYSIVPHERRKGYASKMLSLALEKCKELNIQRVLITCDKENIGSAKTIINNGGHLENEVMQDDGQMVQRYWININK